MNYLFFDIECSNCFGGRGKICEFGYVLTNENFKIIKKDVLTISPGKKGDRERRFDKKIYERDSSFQWAYDEETYFSSPLFPHYYNQLKSLFEDDETIAIGWAVDNDIRYLDSEFKRYKLKPFKYKAFNVKEVIKKLPNENKIERGLIGAFKALCPIAEFVHLNPHLSRDDAYMSMRVLQEILIKLNMSMEDILENYPNSLIDANEYINKYYERKKTRSSKKKVPNENQDLWGNFCRTYLEQLEEESSKGKVCTVSKVIKEDKRVLLDVINYIENENLIANDKIDGSAFFIVYDENDKERMERILEKHPFKGKYILYSEIKNGVLS